MVIYGGVDSSSGVSDKLHFLEFFNEKNEAEWKNYENEKGKNPGISFSDKVLYSDTLQL